MRERAVTQPEGGYGVLTRRRLSRWIGALVAAAAAVAVLVGFLGASHGVSLGHFNWSLAAVTGTAVGTVLLAGFTGALAWTTSGDVRATIRLADVTQEDQRNRNRPIIAVRVLDVTTRQLDPSGRRTVEALPLWIKNVGLAPALDLRLRATYGGTAVPTEEVISVVGVDEERGDRAISLAATNPRIHESSREAGQPSRFQGGESPFVGLLQVEAA